MRAAVTLLSVLLYDCFLVSSAWHYVPVPPGHMGDLGHEGGAAHIGDSRDTGGAGQVGDFGHIEVAKHLGDSGHGGGPKQMENEHIGGVGKIGDWGNTGVARHIGDFGHTEVAEHLEDSGDAGRAKKMKNYRRGFGKVGDSQHTGVAVKMGDSGHTGSVMQMGDSGHTGGAENLENSPSMGVSGGLRRFEPFFERQGRFNWREFREYYAGIIAHRERYVPKWTPAEGAEPGATQPWSARTEYRATHYYEPYWVNGHWVYQVRVSPPQDYVYHEYPLASGRTYPATTRRPDGATWVTWRFCFPSCLTPYKDFGRVCGTRLQATFDVWRWAYMEFENMCALEHANCAYFDYSWVPLHRGPCPQQYLNDAGTRAFPDDWLAETADFQYPWPIASRAASLANMTFRPYRQGVYALINGTDFTYRNHDWDDRRRMRTAALARSKMQTTKVYRQDLSQFQVKSDRRQRARRAMRWRRRAPPRAGFRRALSAQNYTTLIKHSPDL